MIDNVSIDLDFFLVNYLTVSDDLSSNHRICWCLDFESFRCRNGDDTLPPDDNRQKTTESHHQKWEGCLKLMTYQGGGERSRCQENPEKRYNDTCYEENHGKEVYEFWVHRITDSGDLRCCPRMLPGHSLMIFREHRELSGDFWEILGLRGYWQRGVR